MLKFPRDLYSDVRVEDVAETTLVLEDGELKQCTESRRRGAFVRVYDGKRWYNSATTEPDRLQQELDTLAAMAEPNPAIGDDPVVHRFEVNRDCVLRWQAGDLRAVPVEQKLALLRSYQPLLERSGLAATRARYLDVHVDKTFRSSLGADIRQDYQHCGIALSYTVTGANAPFTNGRQRYASDFAGLQGCQEGLRAAIAEAIHNDGGEIVVTEKMKRFFWHKYYEATGSFGRKKNGQRRNDKRTRQLGTEADFWRFMALKRAGTTIRIPRRRFLGTGPEVERIVREIIEDNLNEYFDMDFSIERK